MMYMYNVWDFSGDSYWPKDPAAAFDEMPDAASILVGRAVCKDLIRRENFV
jgi:hypothetical protein